jgi:hypothetical protein
MANKKIQELTQETELSNTHLLITEDGSSNTSETKKTALSLLLSWIITGNTFSVDLDELIEGNAISITKNGTDNTATFKFDPPEWTSSTTYVVGDFVLSGNKFYKCNTAHTSSTTIDTVKFTLIGGTDYQLPTASATTLGGVKVDGTTVTVDSNGVISVVGGSADGTKWFDGDTAPTTGMNNGDYWLSTATATLGNVYKYNGTDWNDLVCNIRGAAGTTTIETTSVTCTGTLTAEGWSDTAPYSQTVAVEGITAELSPVFGLVVSDDVATGIAENENWRYVLKATTGAGNVTFYCYEARPSISLNFKGKVV